MAKSFDSSLRYGTSDEYRGERSLVRKADSVQLRPNPGTSDEYIDPWCDPCENEGKYVKVFSYCPTCVEFFCKRCHESHKNFDITRRHTVKRDSDMPSSQADKPVKYEMCVIHAGALKEHFCVGHEIMICQECRTKHEGCKVMHAIDVSKRITSFDNQELEREVCNVCKDVVKAERSMEKNIKDIEEQRDRMFKTAEKEYELMKSHLASQFKKTIKNIQTKHSEQQSALSYSLEMLRNGKSPLNAAIEDLGKVNKSSLDNLKAFIKMQSIVEKTRQTTKNLHEMTETFQEVAIKFDIDKDWQSFMSTKTDMGKAQEVLSPFSSAVSVREICFPEVYIMPLQKQVLPTRAAKDSRALIVGAIDIGTTFSGWAYSFLHEFLSDPTQVTVKHWNTGTSVTEKTPTCVLISPDGKKLKEFGYNAEDKYCDLTAQEAHKDYYYFPRFKMALNKKKRISRDILIEDAMGKRLPAIDVFSVSIAALVDDMIGASGSTVPGGLNKADVHWVLTVPASWSDAAKLFMREAARKKPASIETEKLTIALEPEASSILQLSAENMKSTESISSLPTGTKYMTLDAGGNTDITVHEVISTGGLKQVLIAQGEGLGGFLVDEAFENLLTDILGRRVYKQFVKIENEDYLDLWRHFDSKKKIIDPSRETEIVMKLPFSLIEIYQAETGRDLRDMISESKYASQIQLRRDKIIFSSHLFQGLFSKYIDTTVAHVNYVLRQGNAKDIKAILMVGGFSKSLMLQEAIKRAFADLIIIIPTEASSAVLRGAVMFGHNPAFLSGVRLI